MILLFGLPRSGTTWIGKIFDSHPSTLYRHEPDSWRKAMAISVAPPLDCLEAEREAMAAYVAEILRERAPKVSASLPMFPKAYYGPATYLFRRITALGAKALSRPFGQLRVPEFVDPGARPEVRLVWKSIESVGRLGAFARILAGSRAILILRHPCGQIASVLRGESGRKFEDRGASSEDYGIFRILADTEQARNRGITIDALHEMHPVERLAWRWVLFNEKAMEETAGMPSCMTLRYEDVCRDPHGMAEEMLGFAGLDWCSQTRDFVAQSVASDRSGYYSLVRDPLRAAYAWRDELPAEDIARIGAITRESTAGRIFEGEF